MSFTTTKKSYVFVPGYVAVPQGQINIAVGTGMGANKDVELVGAVLAAKVIQTTDQPATLSLGMVNRIVPLADLESATMAVAAPGAVKNST